jgi:hypothetical protein
MVVYASFAGLGLRWLVGYGVTFYGSFEKIEPGMDERRVLELLGEPDEKSATFRLGQYEGSETEYARAAASGSSKYLLWFKGIDLVYAVGIDKSGRVTVKALGGT